MNECLHCAVMETVNAWVEKHGPISGGKRVFDVVKIIEDLAQCTVEVSQMPPGRSQRNRAHRFAHNALDAHLKSQRTGQAVAVEIPAEH